MRPKVLRLERFVLFLALFPLGCRGFVFGLKKLDVMEAALVVHVSVQVLQLTEIKRFFGVC